MERAAMLRSLSSSAPLITSSRHLFRHRFSHSSLPEHHRNPSFRKPKLSFLARSNLRSISPFSFSSSLPFNGVRSFSSLTPRTLAASHSESAPAMDSNSVNTELDSEVLHEFLFFNVLKDGRVNVFAPKSVKVPPADDPLTGVKIRDVQISSDVSARIFLPPSSAADEKFPVFFFVHGGGFCKQSAFSSGYTSFVSDIVAGGRIIAVSVEYGLFPSRPIPACYEDSWEALQWVADHVTGAGTDPWLSVHAGFNRFFIGGDSAGANICHTLAARAGLIGLAGAVQMKGMILIQPYFGEDDKMWMYMCPKNEGPRDRRMKAAAEDLANVQASRVLVAVGEMDGLKEAGTRYATEIVESGWKGTVEVVENKGKDHGFNIRCPQDEEAIANKRRFISFINSTF